MSIEELAVLGVTVDRPLPDVSDITFPDIEPTQPKGQLVFE